MHCRSILLWSLAALLAAHLAPTSLKAQDDWTDSDRDIEHRAAQLLGQGQNEAADALYRQLIQIHPYSSEPLVFHILALNAMGRFSDVLTESRKAVAMDPDNFAAQQWLGISLYRLGQYTQAIEPLEKSIQLDHYYNESSVWLAEVYRKNGNPKRADQILEALLQDVPEEKQGDAMAWIAHIYYEIGDSKSAVAWWQRSAALGIKTAADWLSWAYSDGYGVPPDNGNSAYWSRRGDDTFAWFPRFPLADKWIDYSHGWVIVLIALASAIFLPLLTIGAIGYCVGYGVTTDPAVHWAERARRSYPFQTFLGLCVMLFPILYAGGSTFYPSLFLPIPKWPFIWTIFFINLLSTNWVVVRLARRYHKNPGSVWRNLKNLVVILFLYTPVFIIFGIMAVSLPPQWNLQAVLTILAGILAYFWLQFGGWIRLGRLLHLIGPADKGPQEAARELAQRWKQQEPRVWSFHWRRASAMAFPFSNAILITKKLCDVLSPEEVKVVLAHEMAHLCEDRSTRLMRLLTPPVLILPLFTLSLWWTPDNWAELVACYFIIIAGAIILRKRSRRMEERADAFGSKADEDTRIYPQVLAKLYEMNHVPAVMPGKRMIHPHLYDRLLAAGTTPDYPRPKPPRRWGTLVALLTVALNGLCLTAIWLLLF